MNIIDLGRGAVCEVLADRLEEEELNSITRGSELQPDPITTKCQALIDRLVAVPTSTDSIREELMQNKEFYGASSTACFDPALRADHDTIKHLTHRL